MPLIQNGDEILIDARLLHKSLKGKDKDFRHWIMDRIKEYNFEEGKDYFRSANAPGAKTPQVVEASNNLKSQKEIKNGMQVDYHITIDMAKELSMIERNDIGKMFRRYFISKEKEARQFTAFLTPPTQLLKGLPCMTINNVPLYSFSPLMKLLGYSHDTADSRKNNYPNHFMKIGSRLYVTEAYANHLFKSSLIIKSRRAVKAMQPILALDFGQPLEIK